MHSQMTALKQANEAISIRRKRKRKAFRSRYALSVREVQAIVDEDYIEAEIREDVLKPKKRASKCSGYGQKGQTGRICTTGE